MDPLDCWSPGYPPDGFLTLPELPPLPADAYTCTPPPIAMDALLEYPAVTLPLQPFAPPPATVEELRLLRANMEDVHAMVRQIRDTMGLYETRKRAREADSDTVLRDVVARVEEMKRVEEQISEAITDLHTLSRLVVHKDGLTDDELRHLVLCLIYQYGFNGSLGAAFARLVACKNAPGRMLPLPLPHDSKALPSDCRVLVNTRLLAYFFKELLRDAWKKMGGAAGPPLIGTFARLLSAGRVKAHFESVPEEERDGGGMDTLVTFTEDFCTAAARLIPMWSYSTPTARRDAWLLLNADEFFRQARAGTYAEPLHISQVPSQDLVRKAMYSGTNGNGGAPIMYTLGNKVVLSAKSARFFYGIPASRESALLEAGHTQRVLAFLEAPTPEGVYPVRKLTVESVLHYSPDDRTLGHVRVTASWEDVKARLIRSAPDEKKRKKK